MAGSGYEYSPIGRFGTDGVRGLANVDLQIDFALELARVTGMSSHPLFGAGGSVDRVAIGRDPRRSGPMLEAAMVAGFTSVGVDVILLGVVPTPAVAWVSAVEGIPGVMISASHNPFADNGIKIFGPGGRKLTDEQQSWIEADLQARFRGEHWSGPAGTPVGAAVGSVAAGAIDGWIDAVVATAPDAGRGLHVVADAANGAAADVAARILTGVGARVDVIGADPDGTNINDGVGSTHPARLQAAVVETGADIGLAFDGDADRLIAVDHLGRIVDGDHILGILAVDRRDRGRLHADTLVITVMSNLGLRLAMEEAGIHVVETPVGDRHVLEALEAGADGAPYSLGGEQSGHVICRDLATTGDGLLAAVQLLDAVTRADLPLADLADATMTTYPQVLRNVRLAAPAPGPPGRFAELPISPATVMAAMADDIAAAEAELGDQGRVLVRPSGTEPLLRIMVEHLDAATADAVCDRLVAVATERGRS